MNRSLSAIACIFCLFTTVYAEDAALTELAMSTRILFKVFLFLSLYLSGKQFISSNFLTFLVATIVIDLLAYSPDWEYTFYMLSLGMYIILFKDVWKQFKMNRINYTLWSFVGVCIINGLLIGIHIKGLIYSYQGGDGVLYLQRL